MKKLLVLALLLSSICGKAHDIFMYSPNGTVRLEAIVTNEGVVQYRVNYKGKAVMLPSTLSMRLKSPDVLLKKFYGRRS